MYFVLEVSGFPNHTHNLWILMVILHFFYITQTSNAVYHKASRVFSEWVDECGGICSVKR
jgi:hypothetical protein